MQEGKFYAINRFTVTLTTAILCLGQGLSLAQVKPVAQKGWETTAAAGVTLTRGNSRTFLANVSLDTRRKWARDEAALGVSEKRSAPDHRGSLQVLTSASPHLDFAP